MLRIKTHTPLRPNTKIVKVSDKYTCEIIYSHIQMYNYYNLTQKDSWEICSNEEEYNSQIADNHTHYLVFRLNGFSDYPKKMSENFPTDTYGTSLLLVQQDNRTGEFCECITRWNNGKDCGVPDLGLKTKYVEYDKFLEIVNCDNNKFLEIFNIWKRISINLNKNTMDIAVQIPTVFSLNLNQEDLFNNTYVKKVAEQNINEIIDYEKQQFSFNYISNGKSNTNDFVTEWDFTNGEYCMNGDWNNNQNLKVVNRDDVLKTSNSLTFNLNFRYREAKTYTGYTAVNYEEVFFKDYGSWSPSDDGYWFNSNIPEGVTTSSPISDMLGYLGFTDEDIYFQKDCLKKSFLRLSVYDTPYRQNQSLLFYSTLFFDTNSLYKKYVDYVNENGYGGVKGDYVDGKGVIMAKQQIVYQDKDLCASFTCSNRFKQDACSDGFYLYLFDDLVNGNTFTKLYLKVEFNNAKNGKTVPLIWPGETPMLYGNNRSSGGTLNTCRKHYEVTKTEQGQTTREIDMNSLLTDLYIPIGVKYNKEKNEYVWFIINYQRKNICPNADGNITLNLFEPRINNTEED